MAHRCSVQRRSCRPSWLLGDFVPFVPTYMVHSNTVPIIAPPRAEHGAFGVRPRLLSPSFRKTGPCFVRSVVSIMYIHSPVTRHVRTEGGPVDAVLPAPQPTMYADKHRCRLALWYLYRTIPLKDIPAYLAPPRASLPQIGAKPYRKRRGAVGLLVDKLNFSFIGSVDSRRPQRDAPPASRHRPPTQAKVRITSLRSHASPSQFHARECFPSPQPKAQLRPSSKEQKTNVSAACSLLAHTPYLSSNASNRAPF